MEKSTCCLHHSVPPFQSCVLKDEMIPLLCPSCRKLKKSSSELADRLGSLSLEEPSSQTGNPIEQRLSQLEKIFSFPTAEPSVFPQQHCQQFITQLQDLPTGTTGRFQCFIVARKNIVNLFQLNNIG